AGRAYKAGGGRIDLDAPERRFWLVAGSDGGDRLFEEVARIDRQSASARRMPTLPFQRPVSLPPRLARAAANLARARPGDRVLDPFVGTGALLAEAALLGARVYGIDRDAEMVRGALRNLAHLGVVAEELVVGEAASAAFAADDVPWDAILTDPPYGRASSTGGESTSAVLERVLSRWSDGVRPGGRLVVVVPGPVADPGPGWRTVVSIPIRVHRSLTREFRVYERDGSPTTRA
ncbi:MAG: DNA methyltransferase, partial [Thermoplasmata archaeon]